MGQMPANRIAAKPSARAGILRLLSVQCRLLVLRATLTGLLAAWGADAVAAPMSCEVPAPAPTRSSLGPAVLATGSGELHISTGRELLGFPRGPGGAANWEINLADEGKVVGAQQGQSMRTPATESPLGASALFSDRNADVRRYVTSRGDRLRATLLTYGDRFSRPLLAAAIVQSLDSGRAEARIYVFEYRTSLLARSRPAALVDAQERLYASVLGLDPEQKFGYMSVRDDGVVPMMEARGDQADALRWIAAARHCAVATLPREETTPRPAWHSLDMANAVAVRTPQDAPQSTGLRVCIDAINQNSPLRAQRFSVSGPMGGCPSADDLQVGVEVKGRAGPLRGVRVSFNRAPHYLCDAQTDDRGRAHCTLWDAHGHVHPPDLSPTVATVSGRVDQGVVQLPTTLVIPR